MEISYLLARVLGITLIVIFSAILINQKFYHGLWQDVSRHPISLVLSGLIILICGLLVINVHNVWTSFWQSLITFLGWVFVIGGIFRIIFPQFILQISERMMERKLAINIMSAIMLIIGIYLTVVGFSSN